MDKVEATCNFTYVFGEVNKAYISIKKGQRWYVVKEGNENTPYCLERDNVKIQIIAEEFNSLFVPSKRYGKYGG